MSSPAFPGIRLCPSSGVLFRLVKLFQSHAIRCRARTALADCIAETRSFMESIDYSFGLSQLGHFDHRVVFSRIQGEDTIQPLTEAASKCNSYLLPETY